jgi:hypothetical protein
MGRSTKVIEQPGAMPNRGLQSLHALIRVDDPSRFILTASQKHAEAAEQATSNIIAGARAGCGQGAASVRPSAPPFPSKSSFPRLVSPAFRAFALNAAPSPLTPTPAAKVAGRWAGRGEGPSHRPPRPLLRAVTRLAPQGSPPPPPPRVPPPRRPTARRWRITLNFTPDFHRIYDD